MEILFFILKVILLIQFSPLLICLGYLLIWLGLLLLVIRQVLKLKNRGNNGKSIAFIHPFCNAAAGGEKVLWQMVHFLSKNYPSYKIYIYCSEIDKDSDIYKRTRERFQIDVEGKVHFVRVGSSVLVKPSSKLTMLVHIIGGFLYGIKCSIKHQPDFVIDTTGLASSFFAFRIISPDTRRLAYVHYPFISDDMINLVKEGKIQYNNQGFVARNKIFRQLKLIYYKMLCKFYKRAGNYVEKAYCNSSWTFNHMKSLWKNTEMEILYPPCNIRENFNFNIDRRDQKILSLAQFRPEKNQKKQIEIFSKVITKFPDTKFMMVGTCRDEIDARLVNELKQKAKELNVDEKVEFLINAPYSEIKSLLASCKIGLHTMENEHFGISVVEMMASGMITLAHDSAGPKLDIIKESGNAGYLCDSSDDYAANIIEALNMNEFILHYLRWKSHAMIEEGRKNAFRFSNEAFNENLKRFMALVL